MQLRKGGANLLGLCPFHNEKTPSFTVSPAKQFYHCFGCGAHGSAITFLMNHTGASFPDAVRSLASEAGMQVPERPLTAKQREQEKRARAERSRHQSSLNAAQQFYIEQLKLHKPAIEYLKSRGLTGITAARFGLGWSGSGRRSLSAILPDYESTVAIETGLVIEAEDGTRYDRFRNRIMFPIRNNRGNIVGFGGRLINDGEPKYLNSPETPVFSKGRELYGLWEARKAIRDERCVLVVEGYMDVVALAQHGLGNAVATLGTATTPAHIEKLIRASDRIIFCFDGDNAGRKAAWRALETSLPLLRDETAFRFLFLDDGDDPDSYIHRYGINAFRDLIDSSMPLSGFMLDHLSGKHELTEPEGRASCTNEAIPLLNQIPESSIKLQIEQEFARTVRLTHDELKSMLITAADKMPQVGSDKFDRVAVKQQTIAIPDQPKSRQPIARASGSRRQKQLRSVTPIARRLVRLLLAHPKLVKGIGSMELEILENHPQLILVRELVTLINSSGAHHTGALLEASEPDSDLSVLIASLATDLLVEDLPDPDLEWRDALVRIETDAIRAEQSALIKTGLLDDASKKRYQELNRQLMLLNNAGSREKQ